MENFSSGLPPEPRSPDMQRFRPSDHSRHRMKDVPVHYEERSRRSGSPPEYFENHYTYRSPSPTIRPYSPNHQQMPMSPPPNRDLSSPPLRDRPSHSSDRSRRRRTPTRHDRSRDRRRRISPRRRTPPSGRSPIKRRNGQCTFYFMNNIFTLIFRDFDYLYLLITIIPLYSLVKMWKNL